MLCVLCWPGGAQGVKELMDLSLRQPVRLAADLATQTPKGLTQEVLRLKVGAPACTHAPTNAQQEPARLPLLPERADGQHSVPSYLLNPDHGMQC